MRDDANILHTHTHTHARTHTRTHLSGAAAELVLLEMSALEAWGGTLPRFSSVVPSPSLPAPPSSSAVPSPSKCCMEAVSDTLDTGIWRKGRGSDGGVVRGE